MPKKPKRHDLIGISLKILERKGRKGTFEVTVMNDTATEQKHAVGIVSDVPLWFVHDGKILNFTKRPSTFAETGIKRIRPATAERFLFHWTDTNDDFKSITLYAKFMNARSEIDEIL